MRSNARSRGFTLMEILISMTILMIGLLPMLAVFKTALNNLNRSIEDTYASAVAQSVLDAIRMGLHDLKVDHGPKAKFFLFEHDGIAASSRDLAEKASPDGLTQLESDRRNLLKDADISKPDMMPRLKPRDYCIMVPCDQDGFDPSPPGYTGSVGIPKGFLYPRKDPSDNEKRQGLFFKLTGKVGSIQGRKVLVEKVFWLGQKLRANKLGDGSLGIEKNDTLQQYGFAFTMRVAKGPLHIDAATGAATIEPDRGKQDLIPTLYEVCVMIFRNFSPNPDAPRNEVVGGAGREFISFVSE